MTDRLLTIGEVAGAAGVTVSAVRYYDEIGLVSATARVGGKRRFDEDAVGRVNFVRRAQDVGFSLDEVALIVEDTAGGWRELVRTKLAELDAQRKQVDAMIAILEDIQECGCEVVSVCSRVSDPQSC